ncbi:MAG: NAD(P)H-dependent oxidoreductase [Erysipelotrichales bacterium]
MKKLGVIVGSLRKDSYNKKVAEYFMQRLEGDFDINFIEIGNLELFNEDLEDNEPASWNKFRTSIKEMDAFLFVTPEYNRSIPGALKNALDVASRPFPNNEWAKKPTLLVTASPGGIGGFGAGQHFRNIASMLNMYVMPQPEVYLGQIHKSFDENGSLTNERTTSFLDTVSQSFIEWTNNF